VHDGKERFAGIIELNDIKQKLFEPGQSDKIPSRSIMKKTAGYLTHIAAYNPPNVKI